MSLTCFNCGREMGDYTGEAVNLSTCSECKAEAAPYFYRAATSPEKLLRSIFLHGEYRDIIGVESDVGATRIYTGSPEAIDQGVVMMHYIRSEEVPFTDALRERLKWKAAT